MKINEANFYKEAQAYSLEELNLIYETQKDLYSEEEIRVISDVIIQKKQEEKEEIEKTILSKLPKEIICPKCDGPSPFENDTCRFCGCKLDKHKYYQLEYYEKIEENSTIEASKDSHVFQYVISFIIPLIGFILGAILLSKDSEDEKSLGKSCIIIGIISVVVCSLIWFSSI